MKQEGTEVLFQWRPENKPVFSFSPSASPLRIKSYSWVLKNSSKLSTLAENNHNKLQRSLKAPEEEAEAGSLLTLFLSLLMITFLVG